MILLFTLALLGVGLAAIGDSWSERSRRDREQELLWAGSAYVRAIGSYYAHSPGEHRYPRELQDLLEDRRFVDVQRHLRRLYRDPLNPAGQWRLIRAPDGGIMGVATQSDGATMHRQEIRLPGAGAISGSRYSDWRFVYMPPPSRENKEAGR